MNKYQEIEQINKKVRKLRNCLIVNSSLLFFCIILIILKIKPYEVSEATFIATMITSMGVLFTVIASYQIYNIIELNHRFKQVNETEAKMNAMLVQFNQRVGNMDDVIHRTYAYGLTTRALSAITNNKKDEAALLIMEGILEYLDVTKAKDVIEDLYVAINNLQNIAETITQVSNKWKDDANIIVNKIKGHVNYTFISIQFEKIKVIWE